MLITTTQQLTRQFAGGLRDEKPDGTEFSLDEFGAANIERAPKTDWVVPNLPPTRDQQNTDFCVAWQGMYTMVQDFGIDLSPAFLFAATKKRYYNNYYGFGLGIKKMLGTLQKDGICKEELYPFGGPRNYMANYRNIPPEAWHDAATRKLDKGYFLVDIFDNPFDNMLAGAHYWQELVITGLKWYNGFYLDNKSRLVMRRTGNTYGHSFSVGGSKMIDGEQYARCKNSYNSMPEFYVSREQMRHFYYGYIALPVTRDIAEIILKYAGKIVKGKTTPHIYLIQDGAKRRFRSENILNLYGISLNQYIEIDDGDLSVIPEGENINKGDLSKPAVELIKRNNIPL